MVACSSLQGARDLGGLTLFYSAFSAFVCVSSGVPAYDAALFASLSPSIPDIAPKGTGRDGDFDGVVYDTTTDPDCWVSQLYLSSCCL